MNFDVFFVFRHIHHIFPGSGGMLPDSKAAVEAVGQTPGGEHLKQDHSPQVGHICRNISGH